MLISQISSTKTNAHLNRWMLEQYLNCGNVPLKIEDFRLYVHPDAFKEDHVKTPFGDVLVVKHPYCSLDKAFVINQKLMAESIFKPMKIKVNIEYAPPDNTLGFIAQHYKDIQNGVNNQRKGIAKQVESFLGEFIKVSKVNNFGEFGELHIDQHKRTEKYFYNKKLIVVVRPVCNIPWDERYLDFEIVPVFKLHPEG